MQRVIKWIRGGDDLSARVRRVLVASLYSQPVSLAAGAISGILASGVAAVVSGSDALYGFSFLLALIAVVRVSLAFALSPSDERISTDRLEATYAAGAFAYSFTLGTSAATAIALQSSTGVIAIMLITAVGYGVGACGRNSGRPAIAIGQLAFATLPIAAVAFANGTFAFFFIGFTICAYIFAMVSIVENLFKTLRDSIASAETSAELADKMQALARTDVVTGLANRAGLNHATVEKLAALKPGKVLALFWLDLDRFKEVNDVLGHQVGDRVLAEVAKRLREVADCDAVIGRFGGDEFIVLCEVAGRTECEHLAERLLENATLPMLVNGERLEVPASMGISLMPHDASDVENLMQAADLALYHAKVGGKNHARFFDKSMSRNLVRRREIEAELRAAIQRDELSIFFQPIVDLATGRIRTFEALVRWFHPEKGELKPDEFIPVAEETGLIITLGNWITTQAARAATHWPDEVSLAVNLSPLQIKAPGAALGIIAALRESGLDPARLELEVTESLFLEDSGSTANFITELSAVGVKFALDDFGTGYSSLGYIEKYPFHTIKVDRSFVSGPNVGRKSGAIIRAVAELGAQLDMAIVAEGLETIEQVQAVRAAGCTLGQGYYFSRAVPDYLAAMLLSQERDEVRLRAVG